MPVLKQCAIYTLLIFISSNSWKGGFSGLLNEFFNFYFDFDLSFFDCMLFLTARLLFAVVCFLSVYPLFREINLQIIFN